MPVMYLNTNLLDKDVPAEFDRELCTKVGEVLNKPFEKIILNVHTGVRQIRGGSSDPLVSLDIHSIDVFDKDRNPTYSTPLITFMSEKLGIPEASSKWCVGAGTNHVTTPHLPGTSNLK